MIVIVSLGLKVEGKLRDVCFNLLLREAKKKFLDLLHTSCKSITTYKSFKKQ